MALVVGKGESIRFFRANGLENVPEMVISLCQKAVKFTPKAVKTKLRSLYMIYHRMPASKNSKVLN